MLRNMRRFVISLVPVTAMVTVWSGGAIAASKRASQSPKPAPAPRSQSPASLTLDYLDGPGFGLTVASETQGAVSVDFVWDADRQQWQAVFPPDAVETTIGADVEAWSRRVTREREVRFDPKRIDPSVVNVPHDDVTLFSLPEDELLFLCLWQEGNVSGIYYSFHPAADMERRAREQMARDTEGTVADGVILPALCYFIDCYCFVGRRVACLISTLMGCHPTCLP